MKSIKTKITCIILVICIIVGGTIGFFSLIKASMTIRNNTSSDMKVLANQAAATVSKAVESEFAYLQGVASNDMVKNLNVDQIEQKKFLISLAKARGAKDMGFAGVDGKTLTDDLVKVADISQRPYFLTAIKGGQMVSDPFEDSAKPGVIIVQFAVPVYNGDEIVGILYMLCNGEFLANITDNIAFGKSGGSYMVNSEGTFVANNDPQLVLERQNILVDTAQDHAYDDYRGALQKAISGENGYTDYTLNGEHECISYQAVEGTSWFIIVHVLYDEIYGEMNQMRTGIFIITFLAILIFSILGFLIARRITRPITLVRDELTRMSKQDFSSEVPSNLLSIKDETGDLSRALNLMQTTIREALFKVEEQAKKVDECAETQKKAVAALRSDIESVSATTQELSASSEETAASTAQMHVSINDAQGAVGLIANRSQDGAKTANEIGERAQILKKDSKEAEATATSVYKNSMETLSQAIASSQKVNEINQLSNTILSITEQTNLLALNASIEAARAGEAGKGFAVVATEIGKLAENSQQSVRQIKEVADGVIESVENLGHCATDVLKFLDEIVMKDYQKLVHTGEQYNEDAVRVEDIVSDLSASTQELLATITNVADTLDGIASATEESAKGATEIAQSNTDIVSRAEMVEKLANETSLCSDNLARTIREFKLS